MNNHVIRSLELTENHWHKHAQVMGADSFSKIEFENDRIDFLFKLMPFTDCPLWEAVEEKAKQRVASYGWVMYNMRTICIESKMLTPLCNNIINGKIQIIANHDFNKIISQTLVDESYHTFISIEGCQIVLRNRQLPRIHLPEFNFFKKLEEKFIACEKRWEKELTMLGAVISSEVLISDYLATISTSEIIQPLCRIITQIHWKDELAHANVFKLIAQTLIRDLDIDQQNFLLEMISEVSKWFCDRELKCWESILLFNDIPHAKEIIASVENKPKVENRLADKKIKELLSHLSKSISEQGDMVNAK